MPSASREPVRRRPAGHRATGHRTTRPVVFGLVALAVAALLAGPTSEPARAEGPPSQSGQSVKGVLERLVVEPEHPGGLNGRAEPGQQAASTTTWLRTDSGRLQLPAASVAGIPTGARLLVVLAPAPAAGPDVAPVPAVRSVTVLARSTAKVTPPARGVAAHAVTVLLALPAGARPDTTNLGDADAAIGAAARFWSQASTGRFAFGLVKSVGWTRLAASCKDVWGVWDEAQRHSGFVPGPRRHLIVYVPAGAGCPTGLGTIGDSADAGGYVMVGGVSTSLIAHELGHNLGLGHSNAMRCTGGAADGVFVGGGFGGLCQVSDYGDWYDVMGISWDNLGSLSTAHAWRLGLLAPAAVTTVTTSTQVVLRPVSGKTGLRSLRVRDPAGATYVVEYRTASGADAWLGTAANWRGLSPGVLVRRIDPADTAQTLLLDPNPGDNSASGTGWDFALKPGKSLETASGRVGIKTESITSTSATVDVVVDGSWPTRSLPAPGRLVSGAQVTIGKALVAWGARPV